MIAALLARFAPSERLRSGLFLSFSGCAVRVRTSSDALTAALGDYFRDSVADDDGAAHFEVDVIESEPVDTAALGVEWIDWPREAGKSGLKERYADVDGGRLVWKVRTGMVFFLTPGRAAAVGPCTERLNQVVNLVNNQYIAWALDAGGELCHAAGVGRGGRGLGLAGISGAGKSTLALRLMEQGVSFVSNDRLIVSRTPHDVRMRGIPKQPRVNPGTLLSLESLAGILPDARRAQLRALAPEELWVLEEKYDVDVERVHGEGRWELELPLAGFCVLTWSFREPGACVVRHTTLREEPALLDAIMKHPGPFFHVNGDYDTRGSVARLDPEPYLAVLGDVPLLAVSGGVDFPRAVDACLELLG